MLADLLALPELRNRMDSLKIRCQAHPECTLEQPLFMKCNEGRKRPDPLS